MLTLAVSHNVFLTDQQIIDLSVGTPVQVIGVSIPVWFFKGNTSEPAIEVFCNYYLTNTPEEYPITAIEDGYQINIPQELSTEGKEIFKLEKDRHEKCLKFRKNNKIITQGKEIDVVHTVEISTMDRLVTSLS